VNCFNSVFVFFTDKFLISGKKIAVRKAFGLALAAIGRASTKGIDLSTENENQKLKMCCLVDLLCAWWNLCSLGS
jgi:hypothetical protein